VGASTGKVRVLETAFLPSVHGFGFPNAWEGSVVRLSVGGRPFVIAIRGRCGGMAFAALDLFRAGEAASRLTTGRELPERSSALARYIMRRQVESLGGGFGANIARFMAWTLMPTGTSVGTAAVTRRRELGKVLVSMVAKNPVPVGLLTVDRLGGMGLNHQVVAYAAERDDHELRIRVYDPNFPGRDDVVLTVPWNGSDTIVESVGSVARKQWRGLFVESYSARVVPPGVRERSVAQLGLRDHGGLDGSHE